MLNRTHDDAKREKYHVSSGKQCRALRRDFAPDDRAGLAGLRAGLACLIADCQACGGTEIEFCDDLAAGELASELQKAVFSIVRELLSNACRHGKSRNVLVGLTRDDDCLCVQVQDWGVGFGPRDQGRNQRGLDRLREMVACLGGTIRIDSQPGKGTCVMIDVALSSEAGRGNGSYVHKAR